MKDAGEPTRIGRLRSSFEFIEQLLAREAADIRLPSLENRAQVLLAVSVDHCGQHRQFVRLQVRLKNGNIREVVPSQPLAQRLRHVLRCAGKRNQMIAAV